MMASTEIYNDLRCKNCRETYTIDDIDKHIDLDKDPAKEIEYLCINKAHDLLAWLEN